jgi:peptidoglycan/LPS O-acetylase OafA/YrhL
LAQGQRRNGEEMIGMTDLQMWSLLFGLIAAGVTAILKQPNQSIYLRAAIVIGTCALGAVVNVALNGDLDWSNWFHTFLLVAVTAVGLYTTVLKNVLGDIEDKTNKTTTK